MSRVAVLRLLDVLVLIARRTFKHRGRTIEALRAQEK